jgi:hypothetical protein
MPELYKYIDSGNSSYNYPYPKNQSFSHVQKSDGGGIVFHDIYTLSLKQGEVQYFENYPDSLSDL